MSGADPVTIYRGIQKLANELPEEDVAVLVALIEAGDQPTGAPNLLSLGLAAPSILQGSIHATGKGQVVYKVLFGQAETLEEAKENRKRMRP